MKKLHFSIILISIIFGVTSVAFAENNTSFNIPLKYGSTNKVEVLKLQNFLFSLGFLKVAPTGLYLSLTRQAVVDFQKASNVSPASGYFGPLTIIAANQKIVANGSSQPEAIIFTESVTSENNQSASVILLNTKTINWKTSNYPKDAGVNINLLRKVSESPNVFKMVRVIKKDTTNDGQETWSPENGENTNDLYIQVTCSNTYKYQSGCSISTGALKVNN